MNATRTSSRRRADSVRTEIPTLQTVLGPVTMAEQLRRALPNRCGAVTVIRIHILKHHRTRCTFAIEWSGSGAGSGVVGKVYAADRVDVYDAMDAIRRAGFGPDEEFSVPEPLAYIRELRLLLQERVSGPRVKDVLVAGVERDRIEAAERCARWLAKFQAAAPQLGEPSRAADVLQSAAAWSQVLDASGDGLAGRARRLRSRLETAAGQLEPIEPCAGHGHYTCGQVLLADRDASVSDGDAAPVRFAGGARARTAVFDWDGYDIADPARDVACFVVDLKRRAWKDPASRPALDQAADVFLKTYLAESGGRASAGGNLPFYSAALCLRLATRDVEKNVPEKAAAMLDEGLRILDPRQAPRREDTHPCP